MVRHNMFIDNTLRHELARAFRNKHFERTKTGIYFKNGYGLEGYVETQLNGGDWEGQYNLLTTEGMNYLLTTGLDSGSAQTTAYIAPYAANVAPTNALTAATFASTQTEFTNYSETTRQVWTPNGGAASAVISNSNAPAVITISSGGQTSLYGAALIAGASAKSATSGVCIGCTALTTARTGLQATDSLGFRYTITLTSS